jgi:hypothetical protein
MPGESKTTEFLLSQATIMVGPQAKVFELTPALHGIGLVKNVQVTADIGFVELTQGLANQTVSSVNNMINTKISAEVYEYTARNLAYGAGLDASGSGFDPLTVTGSLWSRPPASWLATGWFCRTRTSPIGCSSARSSPSPPTP